MTSEYQRGFRDGVIEFAIMLVFVGLLFQWASWVIRLFVRLSSINWRNLVRAKFTAWVRRFLRGWVTKGL